MTLGTFLKQFPDNDSCLEYIKEVVYPGGITCRKCKKITTFTKIKRRMVYQCSCGYQVAPLANTPFQDTKISLQHWFYVMFLMTNTRSGVSAMSVKRELGVSYPTAWRMMKQIRTLMKYTGGKLTGTVEIDETYLGMKGKNTSKPQFSQPKIAVFGAVERKGRAYMKYVPDTLNLTLIKEINTNIDKTATVYSDQLPTYRHLPSFGYKHDYVTHRIEYVKEGTDVHTQTIEGLWSQVKRGLYGVYRHVSKQHLQSYLDEYGWRYSNRRNKDLFTDLLKLTRIEK